MFSLVQNFFAPKGNPIGIDFGSDCLRLVQMQQSGAEWQITAAASADVPSHVRHDPSARLNFFVEATRDLLTQAKFRGRQVILGLPAASMFIQHLRMPKLDGDAMKKALPWELRGKLPIDPSHALLRHIVAGDVYEGQDSKSEVIVIAAAKEMVNQLLAAAAKAKLDVVGMNVEPKAIVDCFTQLYRRKSDETATNCFIDIGCAATRAIIARGTNLLFARTIPVGGDHFSRAAANGLKIKLDEAKLLRIRIAQSSSMAGSPDSEGSRKDAAIQETAPETSIDNSFALLNAGMQLAQSEGVAVVADKRAAVSVRETASPNKKEDEYFAQARQIEMACREPLNRVIEELELCRRYYETTFPQNPVERLIFVGGEAKQRMLCQQIAQAMGLAAQVGDPMVRLSKNSNIGIESGVDRRQPQPGWAVAIGLSMGPLSGAIDQGK